MRLELSKTKLFSVPEIPPYSPDNNSTRSLSSSFSSSGTATPSPRTHSHAGSTGAIPRTGSGRSRGSSFSRHAMEIESARAAAVANARRRQRRHLDSLNLDPPRPASSHLEDPPGGDVTDYVTSAVSYFHHWIGEEADTPSVHEIESEGQELYLHFFHEQLRSEGLHGADVEEELRLGEYHDESAHLVGGEEVGGACAVTPQGRRQRRISMNLNNFQVRSEIENNILNSILKVSLLYSEPCVEAGRS